MSHPIDSRDAQIDAHIRERQTEVVSLLDELLTADLPPVCWLVPDLLFAELNGQIAHHERPRIDVLADLESWSNYLGAPVVETRRRRHTAVSVTAERDGIEIKIWALVDLPPGLPGPAEPDEPVAPPEPGEDAR